MRTSQKQVDALNSELSRYGEPAKLISRARRQIMIKTGMNVTISPYYNNQWTVSWIKNGWNCLYVTAEQLADELHSTVIKQINDLVF